MIPTLSYEKIIAVLQKTIRAQYRLLCVTTAMINYITEELTDEEFAAIVEEQKGECYSQDISVYDIAEEITILFRYFPEMIFSTEVLTFIFQCDKQKIDRALLLLGENN